MLLLPLAASAIQFSILTTEPGAEVYAVLTSGEKSNLGKTPLENSSLDLKGVSQIVVEKRGFVPVTVPLIETSGNFRINITLRQIEKWSSDETARAVVRSAEALVDQVFHIQKLLDQRKVDQAFEESQILVAGHPDSVSVQLVHANALLLTRRSAEALDAYHRVLEQLGPDRQELKGAVEDIIKTLVPRIPAAALPMIKSSRKGDSK